MNLRYMLVTEGGDDRMLLAPIEWLLSAHCSVSYSGAWANPSALDDRSRNLDVRLGQVKQYYPCDLAFVHRDTDTFTYDDRVAEIREAAELSGYAAPIICAIPVRMTEAWFLFDEAAIKRAADKPTSRINLRLPSHAEVQRRANPKDILEAALIEASGLSGRRQDQFKKDISRRKHLVSGYIEDFSPLRAHFSFAAFENDLKEAIDEKGW